GMAIQPSTGDLWCSVNERDGLGDNLPPDYITRVREGAFYGWPWYYIGNHLDPRWKDNAPDIGDQATVPDVLFQPHSAPLNVVFYEANAFGPEYAHQGFVAMHGSWNRGKRTGYKVVKLEIDKDGKATGVYRDFMTGFVTDDGDVWGRPVGVAVSPDGALFVSDDGSGSIWKVSKSQ
ncbi:MAG TPA: PQQ-dependent sugar dehydrogenase, partial [Alphaproteobacteria bacterium]|nr:PQQ-dependent sugar dehydrogenase [Alphaproteobacteria bacterium]